MNFRVLCKKFRPARLEWLILLSTSLAFTIIMIQASLRKGKLLLPPTYDDVTYCMDGLRQLQAFYNGSFAGLFRSLIGAPPHAPFSTIAAMLSYAVFGIHDWAPYVANAVIVFIYLLFVNSILRRAPIVYRLTGMAFALTIPVMTNAVNEFKPDIFCGLLTAITMWTMARNIVRNEGPVQLAWGGLLLAATLLTKPTFTPGTLFFTGANAALAIVGARMLQGPRFRAGEAVRRTIVPFAIGIGISLPYFLLVWRRLYDYIVLNAFGANKELWAVPGSALDKALYFIIGPGGGFMMGYHLLGIVMALACGLTAALLVQRSRVRMLYHVYFALVCVVTYIVPTRMDVKNPFSGMPFTFLLIFWSLTTFGHLARLSASPRTSRAFQFLAAVPLVCMGLLVLWVRFPIGRDGAEPMLRNRLIANHHEILRQRVLERVQNGDRTPLVFALSTAGLSHNISVLEYLLLKDGITEFQVLDLHRTGDVAAFADAFRRSDIVIANEPNGEETFEWLPSGRIQKDTLALIQGMDDFFLSSVRTTVANRRYYLFERATGFSAHLEYTNFGDGEGPYPQWNLPRVRWGLGPRSTLTINGLEPERPYRLLISASSDRPGQQLDVSLGGKELGSRQFVQPGHFENLLVPFIPASEEARIDFAYRTWADGKEGDKRPRALLFRAIRILAGSSAALKGASEHGVLAPER